MRFNTVFISDVHLGTRACQAGRLLDFLRHHPCDQLYLVGDIVDFWSMSRGIHWTREQNTVVQKVLRMARHGTRVWLIPGNHDEALRDYCGSTFGDIHLVDEAIHTTADGRRLLVVHGDAFDQVTYHHRWVAVLGDMGYNTLVSLNIWLSRMRRLLGISGYWSLAGYAKQKVKRALEFVFDFEDSVVHHVRSRDLDGVVCGHIHWPAVKDCDGTLYANCGDWVDSCSALVEDDSGALQVVRWHPGMAHPVAEDALCEEGAREEETACVS
jgi:UDP-2,3-diacylglucosamine pyrophosphatase LpxH